MTPLGAGGGVSLTRTFLESGDNLVTYGKGDVSCIQKYEVHARQEKLLSPPVPQGAIWII